MKCLSAIDVSVGNQPLLESGPLVFMGASGLYGRKERRVAKPLKIKVSRDTEWKADANLFSTGTSPSYL